MKIALIKLGSFSHINASVVRVLEAAFPEDEVEITDVGDLVDFKSLPNLASTALEYAGAMALGGKKAGDCLEKSGYIFRRIKRAIASRLSEGGYRFSFQTQSQFDASVPGLAHFVYTDHTHLANLSYPGVKRTDLFPERWIRRESAIYENATAVFTMSNHVTKSLLEDYGLSASKVECVYAGSNAEVSNFGNPKRSPGKTILFVGVEWERKGGLELAAAFPMVQEAHPEAKLVVVGCRPDLKGLANCEIVGRVPLEAMESYYCDADVFCLPSRIEPFGIVFIEAMRHRLPIVATNIGAIPDMVIPGVTGEICPPGDVDAIAAGLIKMLDDPEQRVRFGERGEAHMRKYYSWEETGKRVRHFIIKSLG